MTRLEMHEPAHHLFTLHDVLSPEACQALIAESEERGYAEAPITTAVGFVMRPDIRNNTRVMFDDVERAASMWARVREHMPEDVGGWTPCGLNERFRFYRYDPGQRFDWHYDGSFVRNRNERSVLSLLFYLNDDFEGGETRFELPRRGTRLTVVPSRGAALAFEHRIRHTGASVTAGRKYVLRTDVMARRV